MHMNRNRTVLGGVIVLSAVSCLLGQEVVPSPATDSMYRETVRQFDKARLSADQLSKIKELTAKLGPEVKAAEQKARELMPQKRAREAAIARAVAEKLRGARAREALKGAAELTAEERAAFQEANRLRLKFDQAALELLTESQRTESQRPAARLGTPQGFLVVQLSSRLPLPPSSAITLDDAAAALNLPDLRRVIAKYGLKKSERAVKPELLDRLVDANDQRTANEIRCLRTFWQIDIRGMEQLDLQVVLRSLRDLAEVETAYSLTELEEPAARSRMKQVQNPYSRFQGYLDPAPLGIDARAAWPLVAGKGSGVGLVDLERGWNIDHEDLRWILTMPLYGDRKPGNDHGTSVVGEIAAEDNGVGVIGAAPGVDYVALTSRYDAGSDHSEPHIANALVAALFFMDPGDVLLLEVETEDGLPVEVEPLNFAAIRLAVVSKVIVVEPAGNGNHDLDAFCSEGMTVLNRCHKCFRDSGAIMVGSSDPTDEHNKAGASCYGSRLDCFAWGNFVTTTSCSTVLDILDNGGGDDNRSYRGKFNGTSSAAPIIAGAAILMQGLWEAKFGKPLSSPEMRAILSNPRTGTKQGSRLAGHIGVLPNMKDIIVATGMNEPPAPAPQPGVTCQRAICYCVPRRRARARCR